MNCNCSIELLIRSMVADEYLQLEKLITEEDKIGTDEIFHRGRLSILRELLKEIQVKKEGKR